MAYGELILDRYEPLGTAGAGGFGTVQVAWDPRIQRKVAIKTIQLSELDARRASLPGAQAVKGSGASTADRWHGVQPWSEYLAENGEGLYPPGYVSPRYGERSPNDFDGYDADYDPGYGYDAFADDFEGDYDASGYSAASSGSGAAPFRALAHLPGLDEARTAAKLQDVRIVTVFDFEVRGRVAYLIMEYIEGITLTRLLAQYEDYLTLDVVAAVFDAVAGALTVAHKAGVLHLDVKPDNIIINAEGQAKVTDFGLATLADASGEGTTGGGTIGYMPLEQMRRQPLDARSDEWALASVAYEMLTGDNPFRVPSLDDAPAAIEDAELVLPSLCWENIDDQVDDVVFYALDPDPDERYASVADFAEEMDKFLGDAEAGKQQLAVLVADALGLEGGEDDWEDDGWDESEPVVPRSARVREVAAALVERIRYSPHLPLVAQRALVALGVGFVSWTSVSGLTPLASLLGFEGARLVALAVTVLVAVAGAASPAVGILVAGVLLGFSLIVAGQTIVGAAIAAVGLIWCYASYRGGATLGNPDRTGGSGRPVLRYLLATLLVVAVVALCVTLQFPLDAAAPLVVFLVALAAHAFI